MSNQKFRRQRSQISRKIMTQYILSVLGFLVSLFGGYFFAWLICAQFVWQANNRLYYFLKVLQNLSPVLITVLILFGLILLTRHFMLKPLRYLDEVIDAAEKLSQPDHEPIELSEVMRDVQNELNLVREQALRNAAVAKEAEQRKNDLIVYLAHDLKTPLTSVIGYLTLLRDEPQISQEMRAHYTDIALDKAERLEYLINEFFEITRFNLSDITLQYSKVNLTRLLEQLAFEFKPMLIDKNLKCNLNITPDTMIKCDVNKMQRVFDNLLRNAVFYSFEGSTIEITVIQDESETSIKFINHGDTIPKEKLERIFEQFYRLDTARSSNRGGAGLGLAIAKQIVELHHGSITANSENELIEFHMTIPLL